MQALPHSAIAKPRQQWPWRLVGMTNSSCFFSRNYKTEQVSCPINLISYQLKYYGSRHQQDRVIPESVDTTYTAFKVWKRLLRLELTVKGNAKHLIHIKINFTHFLLLECVCSQAINTTNTVQQQSHCSHSQHASSSSVWKKSPWSCHVWRKSNDLQEFYWSPAERFTLGSSYVVAASKFPQRVDLFQDCILQFAGHLSNISLQRFWSFIYLFIFQKSGQSFTEKI